MAGGLGVCLGIFTAANVSGGHVNPAVTTAFWIQGRLGSNFLSNTLMMLIYFAAQEQVLSQEYNITIIINFCKNVSQDTFSKILIQTARSNL